MTRLVIELDAELLDPTWTEQDLIENSVFAFQTWIDRGETENIARHPKQAWRVDTSDITVWTREGYLADLAETG